MALEKPHWRELFSEVVTSGLCTGCAACVIACPHDVLDYESAGGVYRPWHLDIDGGREGCTHGDTGCTLCTRACPRFRNWEGEIDTKLFARERTDEEVYGIGDVVLARASDPALVENGQDGGFVSALLIYALENDVIDAALVSGLEGDGSTWRAEPRVARTRQEVLDTAKSRYTYSANLLAYGQAVELGAERIAVVGMGCMASAPGVMAARKAGKIARRLSLTIGLLCSKTFDDAIFEELFEAKYSIKRADIKKMNIKGVFQIWTLDDVLHEVPLKEARAWTREGCKRCPDFAAEHADISTGGIGEFSEWTLVIVRTDKGRELMSALRQNGIIETRPGDDDPGAVALLHRLAQLSRKRWPQGENPGPRRIPLASS
jgi:coenzyme F420 hydrogenase subunit beta